MTSKTNQLIKESRRLSNEINAAIAAGEAKSGDTTWQSVRLAEVTAQLRAIRKKPPVFSEYAHHEGT